MVQLSHPAMQRTGWLVRYVGQTGQSNCDTIDRRHTTWHYHLSWVSDPSWSSAHRFRISGITLVDRGSGEHAHHNAGAPQAYYSDVARGLPLSGLSFRDDQYPALFISFDFAGMKPYPLSREPEIVNAFYRKLETLYRDNKSKPFEVIDNFGIRHSDIISHAQHTPQLDLPAAEPTKSARRKLAQESAAS